MDVLISIFSHYLGLNCACSCDTYSAAVTVTALCVYVIFFYYYKTVANNCLSSVCSDKLAWSKKHVNTCQILV